MGKTVKDKITDSRKWLKKNAEAGVTVTGALAALETLDASVAEVAALRVKLAGALDARQKALEALGDAMDKARLEKKLKEKETRIKSRLASLTAPQA